MRLLLLFAMYLSQYDNNYVKQENEHNLRSGKAVRRIHHRFQCRTNECRLIDEALRKYNSMLKLGQLLIGNAFYIITPLLPEN